MEQIYIVFIQGLVCHLTFLLLTPVLRSKTLKRPLMCVPMIFLATDDTQDTFICG